MNKSNVKTAYLEVEYIVYHGGEVRVLGCEMDGNIASSVRSLERDDRAI